MKSGLLLFGCLVAGFARGQNPIFDRTDTQHEIEVGRESYDYFKEHHLLSKNQVYIARVDRVLASLVAAMPQKLYPYQAIVVAENDINASCLPGGYICVYEGLLSQLSSDDALASILGHEIGHAARRHNSRWVMKMRRDFLIGMFLFKDEKFDEFLTRNNFRYTRDQERDADAFGTELYLRAGYDPNHATSGMEAIQRLVPDDHRVPYYLRSHPYTEERIDNIRAKAAQLLNSGLKPTITAEPSPELAMESIFGSLPGVAITDNPYLPLRVGEEWEYTVKSGSASSGYKVSVVGVAHTDAGPIARMRMSIAGGTAEYQCLTSPDGVWRRNQPDRPTASWTTEVLFPSLSVSETKTEPVGPWAFQDLGTEDVETPAGKYTGALKVQATSGSRILTLWFAKGVGMVKRANAAAGVEEVLYRYTPGG